MTATGATPVTDVVTPRLLLRLPRASDAPLLADIAEDWEVAEQIASLPHPFTLTDAKAWIAMAHSAVAGGARFLVINLCDGGAPVGVIGLVPNERHYQVGYWIGRRYWGQGYATEAVTAATQHAFEALGARRVRAGVFAENLASSRVLAKAGYVCLGEAVRFVEGLGGERRILRHVRGVGDVMPDRPVVLVAAAALINSSGRVLLARRPEGKDMANLWEFPGGKVEAGEVTEAALARELAEELGIDVDVELLSEFAYASHAYADFHLVMPLFLCRAWQGTPRARASQELTWASPSQLSKYDMPPADVPLVAALAEAL